MSVQVVDGVCEVVTASGSTRTTYRGVPSTGFAVGNVLNAPPPHRARSVRMQWSPFDDPGDVTDDADPGAGRRTF